MVTDNSQNSTRYLAHSSMVPRELLKTTQAISQLRNDSSVQSDNLQPSSGTQLVNQLRNLVDSLRNENLKLKESLLTENQHQTAVSLSQLTMNKQSLIKPSASVDQSVIKNNQPANLSVKAMTKQVTAHKVVQRTILINLPNGAKKRYVQTQTFIHYGEKDNVSGIINWRWWNLTEAQLPSYTVAHLVGYIQQPREVPPMIVTPSSSNTVVQVSYRLAPNKQVFSPKSPFASLTKTNSQAYTKQSAQLGDRPVAIDVQQLRQAIYQDQQDKQQARLTRIKHLRTFDILALSVANLLGCSWHTAD